VVVKAHRETIEITELRAVKDTEIQPPLAIGNETVTLHRTLQKTGQILYVTLRGDVVGEIGPNTTDWQLKELIEQYHPAFKQSIASQDSSV
jgi:hypothetical protein